MVTIGCKKSGIWARKGFGTPIMDTKFISSKSPKKNPVKVHQDGSWHARARCRLAIVSGRAKFPLSLCFWERFGSAEASPSRRVRFSIQGMPYSVVALFSDGGDHWGQ